MTEGSGETLLTVWAQWWGVGGVGGAARGGGSRPALVSGADPSVTLTYEELAELSAGVAGALAARGVMAGDRVLWSCLPTLDSIVVLLGALRLGAVVVAVNPGGAGGEFAYVVGDVRPRLALVGRADAGGWIEGTDESVIVLAPGDLVGTGARGGGGVDVVLDTAQPNDDALIVYTSGTTGQPKGAVHTHASLLAGALAIRSAWGWEPDDRLILALPLFHVHGLCAGLFGTLAAGASAIVFERFDVSSVVDAVPLSSMFFGVPTMYHRLAESGRAGELSRLRLCVSGSAPLAAEMWRNFNEAHHVSVLERYGMSETLLTLSNPLLGERRPGSVGLPLPGVRARIQVADHGGEDGVGELLVAGPTLCRGYWERPDATADSRSGEWFSTGDLATVSDDGYFTIAGRMTELIITGGHNVYPAEVEAVLSRVTSVGEIAVVGAPSAEWGESVVACVVGVSGDPDLGELRRVAERDLAPFKRPREYRVMDALPRNAMGKLVRRELLA